MVLENTKFYMLTFDVANNICMIVCFSLIGLNPLMCSQVDMCTLDTLPMEMEASTVDSSPDAAGPMLAQPVVPQDVHEPQPVQTGQVAQAHVVQQIAPPVTPVTQPSPMPSQPVQSLVVPQPAVPVVQPVQPLPVPAVPMANQMVTQPEQPPQPAVVQPLQPLPVPAVPMANQMVNQPEQPPQPAAPVQTLANVAPERAQPRAPAVAAQPAVPQHSQPEVAAAEAKEREQADKDLQAMGWLTGKSCRPQASPHGTSAAEHVDGSADNANMLRRQKSQVFQLPPDLHSQTGPNQALPARPQPAAVVKLEPVVRQPLPVQSSKPQPMDAEYSRRAAANLLARLKKNPSRLDGLPSLRKMVFEEKKKNDLISMLCENGGNLEQGNLEQVQVNLQQQEEVGRVFSAKKKALRFTKKQMEDSYGQDADKVMKFKESIGMIEEDENNPDGIVYLIAQREDEEDNYNRSGWDVLRIFSMNILSAI